MLRYIVLTTLVWHASCWNGNDYYTDRYSADGISYDADDNTYGLYTSDTYGYIPKNPYTSEVFTGCTLDAGKTEVLSCTGSTVVLANLGGIPNITAGVFDESTTSITIWNCASFELFEDRTFENLTSLQTLIVHVTILNHVPDLSNTAITNLNLAGNKIKMNTETHRGWEFPSTIQRIALMENEIYWIPAKMISGPNLRIASFGNNQLLQIQPSIFGDTSMLTYLGMDGNNITRISRNSLAPLATNVFYHLNLSNNVLEFIQPRTFNQLPELKIIEMHQNSFTKIDWDVFSDIPNLVHLDLHANMLETLGSKAFTNLPSLKELRLHSQKTPMVSIAYNAWSNINDSLRELFVSSNALPTFPHQVMEETNYTNLLIMHADNNLIANITEYGTEAFPTNQYFLHSQKSKSFIPFSAMPNLQIMFLQANLITHINTTDLCELVALHELYIGTNLIRESNMDVDCFACLSVLWNIDMQDNLIQYVPAALQSSDVVPALTQLNLATNKLTFLETGAFTNVSTLSTLFINYNLIVTMENDVFPAGITTLQMSSNEFRFTHKYPFSNLSSLSTLYLNSNEIQYIPDDAFENCTSLSNLYMSDNNIAQLLNVHFANSPLSGEVTFSQNDIGWIEDGTFAHVTSMTHLYLSYNKLTVLPAGGDFESLTISGNFDLSYNRINIIREYTFKDLTVGLTFSLANNQITSIYSNAFNGVSTYQLSFSGNPLRELFPYSFHGVSVSQSLAMSSLEIETIPTRAFTDVSALRVYLNSGLVSTIDAEAFTNFSTSYLYLSNNNINLITNKIFGGTSSVSQDISFDGNEITALSYDAFEDVDLYDIYLSNNNLTLYPQSLTVQEFHEIYLQNNMITEIPTGSLYNQTSLYKLYLGTNQIEYIEAGAFRDLYSVNTLSITNNVLQTLPESLMENMTSMQYLYLSGNQMTHVHSMMANTALKTADFSDNSVATLGSNAFTGLTNLGTLNLGNDPLECSCQLVEILDAISSAITSATCAASTAAVGTIFTASLSSDVSYYTNVDPTIFQCSADNVDSVNINGTEFTITWDQPSDVYFQPNGSLVAPPLTGPIDYDIVCTSSSAGSVTGSKSDGSATAGSGSFSKTFTSADGVVAGTAYECSITVDINGTISAKSVPAVFTTPDQAVTQTPAGPNDIEIEAIYYDFSKLHDDFDDLQYVPLSSVTYVDSPYGAWLYDTTHAAVDQYYRSTSDNREIVDTIILRAQTGTIKRYYTNAFFPVDGQGYGAQSQQDCNGQYHNFGFTSALRTGLVYSGTELITLGGGEAMWLFINEVQMFQYIATDDSNSTCFVLDLSTATINGGYVNVQEGILSGSTCSSPTPSSSNISLALEIGVTYHFDLFHVENRRCTSVLLFEVEDTTMSTDKTQDLPMDYSVTWDEDTQIGEILTDAILNDTYSVGPYTVKLYKGNEERRFTVEPTTYTFTAAAVPSPTLTTIFDLYGNSVSYVECNSTSPLVVMSNDSSSETFSVTTDSIYVALNNELDYEVTQEYYLLLEITDTGTSLTGYIGIRIIIDDVNDNCPVLSPTSAEMTPQPVLVDSPLVAFSSSDADSGENGDIHYVVSSVTEDPAVNFDDSYDLWGDVYLRYTSLVFNVIAMDNGTVPYGMSASINVTVSNTCVLDVLFGEITYLFLVNDTTGEMTLRIPKYWVYDFPCSDVVGLTTGTVLDNMMAASSSFDDVGTGPGRARVDQIENTYSELAGAWVAGVVDTNQYVEVDMGMPYRYTSVHIQGRSDADEWVTTFQLQYYNDTDATWYTYTNVNGTTIYNGNTDRTTVVKYDLDPVILSNKIRVNPLSWNAGNISMRLEFNGCSQDEQLYYDVSCMRCETTYYCEGEGVQKMCGRCDNSTGGPCDRNPVEHSFGLESECQACPAGWICADGYATPCDAFYYVECTNTSCPATCTHCEPGYSCYNGIRTICGNGSWSDGNLEFCEPCDTGTYQALEGQSSCNACPDGYFSGKRMSECAKCEPEEWSSGGSECTLCSDSTECPCLDGTKCYTMSYCFNTGSGGYGCIACEAGLTGDGETCTDVDECTLYNPCFQSRCINTEPGYQCLECPHGYTGTYEDAYAYDVHLRVFKYLNLERSNFTYQECDDIDECATNNGGCDPLMTCVNTVGSYYCDFCASGYMGTNKSGCYLDNFCISGTHDCITEADCIYLGPAQYRCVCKPGYAGNGEFCGLDSDNDGHPDTGIVCTDWRCRKDICTNVPDSMQEDTDGDNLGDNCDLDDDSDGRYDWLDNCQFVSNWNQSDVDGDGFGDACDTCPNLSNADQTDTDGDGDGDDCDTDDDDDGIFDTSDNCPLVANTGQEDADSDGVGDACDNCPSISNNNQLDTNENNYGDACDAIGATNIDEDGDSILDAFDNCPSYMNADQSDIDGDGTGDLCDNDIDADGVLNEADNCPYYSNADQADADGNDVGDVCETDSDADGTLDKNDTCPFNSAINETSFKDYFTVNFDPTLVTTDPVWLVKNNGGEVMQTTLTGMPTALIGNQPYGAVEYKGTWYTDDLNADKYLGFVFGYVSNRKFYIVMWKGKHYNYKEEGNSTYKAGIQGAQLKLVDSTSGPGSTLAEALWHSYDTTSEVTLLWQDPDLNSWEPQLSYRWYLTHKPTIGYINLKIYRGTTLVTDSGDLYDMAISGGRLGVFQFGEFPVTWSDLKADCLEHTNQGLHFDGTDDFVTLDDAITIGFEDSFTIDVWMSLDSGYTTDTYPIICSAEGTICLSMEGGQVLGSYGDYNVTSTTSLNADQWYNVIFRHRIESEEISVFIDGVNEAITTEVPKLNLTDVSLTTDLTMYIGKQNETYFRGTIDEVRIYNEGIQDDEITAHVSLPSLERPVLKSYGTLHFRMEDSASSTTLLNSGLLSNPTATLNGGEFVESYQQYPQFQIAYPNNR